MENYISPWLISVRFIAINSDIKTADKCWQEPGLRLSAKLESAPGWCSAHVGALRDHLTGAVCSYQVFPEKHFLVLHTKQITGDSLSFKRKYAWGTFRPRS